MATYYWRIQRFVGLSDGKPSWLKAHPMRYRSEEAARKEMHRLADHYPTNKYRVVKRKRP